VTRPRVLAVSALVVGILLIVFVVACSGGEEGRGAATRRAELTIADPLTEALRYIPQSAGLVAVAQTDTTQGPLHSALELGRTGAASGAILGQVQQLIGGRIGLSLADEGSALAGAPVVVARTGLGRRARTIGAWVVPDEAVLADLLSAKALSGELTEGVPYRRWTTYTRRGGVYAARDRVLLTASDLPTLRAAITRRLRTGRVGGLTPALFQTAARSGMSAAQALIRVAVSGPVLRSAIAGQAAKAGGLPWVAALTGAGLAVSADADGVHLRARLRTDEATLVDADLPIAPGLDAPELLGEAPVVVGVRNPARTIDVALQAAQLVAPGTVGAYTQVRDLLKRFAGVDVDADIIGTLTQDATVTFPSTGGLTLRAPTTDEEALRDTLSRLGRLGQVAGIAGSLGLGPDTGGLSIRGEDDNRYSILKDDTAIAVLGVRDGVFVASTDPATDVDAVVDATPTATGSSDPSVGALRAVLTPPALTDQLVDRFGLPDLARVALAPLGDATVTARSELGFLSVRADVAVKE
jgi:hypothetical protein